MSNKALANMKSIFDAGSALTVLMNKVLGRKYEHFYEMTNGFEILQKLIHFPPLNW